MAKGPSDIVVASLSGGMNDTDSPHLLPDDQCVHAENVEFVIGACGDRRRGMEAVDLAGTGLDTDGSTIVHLGVHYPELQAITDNHLWLVSALIGSSATIAYRDGAVWTTVTPDDAITFTTPHIFQIQSQSLHNKFFICYKSAEDRMHVFDGTSLRRTGLKGPLAAPTAANTAVAGTFAGVRFYRVRFVVMDGTTVLLRSEPSDELEFTPAGNFNGAIVTRPALVNEGETHWELEASNGDANWYVIATTAVATTTVTDTNNPATAYAEFELSEDIGDYSLVPSARFVIVDQDRPIFGGSFENVEHDSRIRWAPPPAATGVGNDERIPDDTDNYIDLDWQDGGGLTGLSEPVNGSYYAFKYNRIYKIQRTGRIDRAYEAFLLSKTRGAIYGSVISGLDEYGRGCVYFLDPAMGPTRVGSQGIQYMRHIGETWKRVNTGATQVAAHGVFYPDKQQIRWWVATDNSDSPNYMLVSHVQEIRSTVDETGRGWTVFTGPQTQAFCSTIVPELVTDSQSGVQRLSFRPYAGFTSPYLLQRCDVGSTDDGERFFAKIISRPYLAFGSLLNRWGTMSCSLLADPHTNPAVVMELRMIRDFGLEESKAVTTDFIPKGAESLVIKHLDNLFMSDAVVIQFQISDPLLDDEQ